ncbi:MAG: choice-of-anchor Q domain-containing protein [Desulfobacteraceae bacterium]|jgi:hypothetical protein
MKCLLFAISIFFAVGVHAAEYYCDLTLSNDGSGSTNDPWQWSQAENNTNVSAGDTVYLRGSGGNVTLSTNIDANGSDNSPVTYQQWPGQTQARFDSMVIDGTGAPHYVFDGINIDAGTGTTWVTAFIESWSGTGGALTFRNCTIWGFRNSGYSGGDFYPYYLGDTGSTFRNVHTMSFSNTDGLDLTIDNCTFLHGWRILSLYGMRNGNIMVTNNAFDRAGEDFINCSGGTENVTISGNILGQTYGAQAYYSVHLWAGTAAGTWAGHEGDTVTQDTTNASGFYVGQYNGRIYIIADDESNLLSVVAPYTWRLDSDPANIYFSVSDDGDNQHCDYFSTEGCDNIRLDANDFVYQPYSAQAVKFAASANGTMQNCVIRKWNSGIAAVILENIGTVNIFNNIIDPISNDAHTVRMISGIQLNLANNILRGAIYQSGNVTASNNVWTGSAVWSGSGDLTNQDLSDSPSGNSRYFTDFTNGDYTPYDGSSSPQVDAGSAAYAPDRDFLGVSRPQGRSDDIGPYEYNTSYGSGGSGNSSGCFINGIK